MSLLISSKFSTNPYAISGAVTLSYFAFYTAYDKQKKTLVASNLYDLVTLNRGVDWTLVEINKSISLSGLTTMLIAFFPQLKKEKTQLLWISMNLLWAHSIYSFYKFYGYSLQKVLSDKAIKRLSVLLGFAGQIALSAGYWGYISADALLLSAVGLGISHFWTMEVDYKYILQVRPYAYLPFPLSMAAIYYYFKGDN